MELSRNAAAFSIDSLMSTSTAAGDRCQSAAEILSHGNDGDAAAQRGGEGEGVAGVADPCPTDDALVSSAATLLRQITVEDKIETASAAEASPSDLPRRRFFLDFPGLDPGQSVRPKIKGAVYLKPRERFVRQMQRQQRGPYDKNKRRFGNDEVVMDTGFKLHQRPTDTEEDAQPSSPWAAAWEMGDSAPSHGSSLVLEEPVTKTVDGIQVTLENSGLWKMFNQCGTEMIVNRIGRRMFPCVVTTIKGMERAALYRIQMELVSTDRRRYKFINDTWLPVGKADPEYPNESFEHPDSPSLGAHWMQEKVSFAKLKITNNKDTGKTNTVLHSMHKYTPRIIVTMLSSPADGRGVAGARCLGLPTEGGLHHGHLAGKYQPHCFEFPETAFIAVTAYHSQQITQLKIQNNPFAKAFRDADVTAILQGACTFPEHSDPMFTQPHNSGLTSHLHPGYPPPSMTWQNPASLRQSHSESESPDDLILTRRWSDTHLRRYGRPAAPPEFPDTRWSFDKITPSCSSVAHQPYGVDFQVDAAAVRGGHPHYLPQPVTGYDATRRLTASASPMPTGQSHSMGILHDVLQQGKAVRSKSHPKIKFEMKEAGQQPPSSSSAFPFSDVGLALEEGTCFPLRRVSSTAASRTLKRASLPYFSPKKAVSISRYRSDESYKFHKYNDPPRRNSAVEGSRLLRASTGNIRGKIGPAASGVCDSSHRDSAAAGATSSKIMIGMAGTLGDPATRSSTVTSQTSSTMSTDSPRDDLSTTDPPALNMCESEPVNLKLKHP